MLVLRGKRKSAPPAAVLHGTIGHLRGYEIVFRYQESEKLSAELEQVKLELKR